MFEEPYRFQRSGWIEVICGSMFSGKTEELIRRLKRAKIANQTVQIFKPKVDTRYHEENVVSHNKNEISSIPIEDSRLIPELSEGFKVVGIDEAQFFDANLPMVCEELAANGIRVIIAGLDMDYTGKPFGPMPHLLSVAEYITKVHAICMKCGSLASHSYRKINKSGTVLLGETESYEARCRTCFKMGNMMELK